MSSIQAPTVRYSTGKAVAITAQGITDRGERQVVFSAIVAIFSTFAYPHLKIARKSGIAENPFNNDSAPD
jgi:hypothetical protein